MKQRIFQADVVHHHDQNREAANGIELWNSSLHLLRRLSPMGEYSRLAALDYLDRIVRPPGAPNPVKNVVESIEVFC
jgi:hypothetical protein